MLMQLCSQITTNLKNAQDVWGLQSQQYQACEAIMIAYLQAKQATNRSARSSITADDEGKGLEGSKLAFRPSQPKSQESGQR